MSSLVLAHIPIKQIAAAEDFLMEALQNIQTH